ncbi:DUF222 domain-containing protein [Glaciihabitans sp. UYNi722]|uniref:HNH endonuclease signature motif containing protein n=1 Tax=Glaciihabitans sp. UYNi722 TaxID=3156344 RepID=UPI0033993C9D
MTSIDILEPAAALVAFGPNATSFSRLDDEQLLLAQQAHTTLRRISDRLGALIAGEIAHRSRREIGYSGLAQRKGYSSPEALVQSLAQSTRAEASKLVRLGGLMAEHEAGLATGTPHSLGETEPSHSPIPTALLHGLLSADSADAIYRGLGSPDAAVTAELLAAASEQLIEESATLTVDQLYRRARQLRDELDFDGVARREKQQHDDRYLKRWIRPDGMYQASMLLDPENGRQVFAAFDTILSPRRGGPRFIDRSEKIRADAILTDPRSDEQLSADALVDMVRIASAADDGALFGTSQPSVRVLVTREALESRNGPGFIEGNSNAVSLETVERHICDRGVIGIQFDDDGQCVNVGRDQRLFTTRQRVGLSARDGGCRFPGCDRPPSWCEAHHVDQWHRDQGKTDIADGVLLCRHHHMLVHNNHWQILRERGIYWLRPPKSEDPTQALRAMPTRSAALRQLDSERLVV